MPHIHTRPGQIDHTVTMYIFRRVDDELEAMLHMHKKLGKLLPVGGHIELDETPWQAAAHELVEESGYELANMKILQPKLRLKSLTDAAMHPQPIVLNTHKITEDHFHSDMAYALLASGVPTKPLADGESSDIRWMTRAELQNARDDMWHNTREVCLFVMDNLDEFEVVSTTNFSLEKVL